MKKIYYIFILLGLLCLFGCGEKEIIVSFDTDGGTTVNSINVTETGKVTLPQDPEKNGYIFSGWTLDGTLFSEDTTITESITLKAKWIEGVELSFTGAGIEDFTIIVPKGEEVDLPTPTRDGYKFVSWIDENEEEYTEASSFDESMFFEAKWSKIEVYNIVYRDGETTLNSIQITEGEDVPEYTPSKKGYRFDGWYTNTTYTKEFDFDNLTRSNAVYALFTPIEYTVSFKTLTTTIKVKYDSAFGSFPSINLISTTFIGWQYEGKRVFESDIYTYDEDIELEPIIYVSSTFKLSESESISVKYLVGSTGPYTEVEKSGFIFAGWYASSDFTGEAMYTIDTTAYANKILYAKYVSTSEDESYTKKVISEVGAYYEELLDGKYIYEDIELLGTDLYYGALIEWTSDNTNVTSNGKITRTKENQKVALTAKVTLNDVTETFTYNVILKEDIYKDISKSVISSYCYTANKGDMSDVTFLKTVDVINLAFAEIETDGSLTLPYDYLSCFNEIKENTRQYGIRVIITVGPASAPERFDAVAKDATLRKKFAKNVVDAINEYGFAGVDIDWEYPTSTNKTNYTLLMKELYEQVKANNPEDLVTSAIPAGPYTYPNFDLKNSNQYLDYINLMSYDMHSETATTHHSALYPHTSVGTVSGCSISESIATFTSKSCNVPKEKLVIGAAFYGRMCTTKVLKGTSYLYVGIESEKCTSITYTSIKNNYLTLATCKEYWDTTSHAPYCYDTATRTFISYDNAKSIKEKCDYVVSSGVGGIMWWDYGSDRTGELIGAVYSKLGVLK